MANKSVVVASSFTEEAFESIVVDVSDSDSDSGSWQVIDPSDSDDGNFSYGDVTTTDDEDDVADVDDLLHPYGSPSSEISMQSLGDQIARQYQELKDAYETGHHRQIIADNEAVADVDDLLQNPYGSPSYDVCMKSLVHKMDHHRLELKHAYGIDQRHEIISGNEVVADVDKIIHHCVELKHSNEIDHRRDIIGDGAAVKDGGSIGAVDDLYYEDDENDDSELNDELVPKWLNHKFERQRMRKLGKKGKKSKRMAYQNNRPGCVHGKHGLGLKHNLIW